MKAIGILSAAGLLLALTACSADEPLRDGALAPVSEKTVRCTMEAPAASRTYFEEGADAGLLEARWAADDHVAIWFDGAAEACDFRLISGAGTGSAEFCGPVPGSFSTMSAVYPASVVAGRRDASGDVFELELPDSYDWNSDRLLSGMMPMFARGANGMLNFYNLMSVIKISLSGQGLLKSVSLSSADGLSLSGRGSVAIDPVSRQPLLSMAASGASVRLNVGLILLSDEPYDFYLPLPAANYDGGLRIDFEFENSTETRNIAGPLLFEKSVMRSVKPYTIEQPFDLDARADNCNEIWYRSSEAAMLSAEVEFNTPIISQSYSSALGLGLISAAGDITSIEGQLFPRESAQNVTMLRLPRTVRHIGQNALSDMQFESFDFPAGLRSIGPEAFDDCTKLKKIVFNDGFESIGAACFTRCTALESVYLPASIKVICFYSFLQSTVALDHWDGDSELIDSDRHALYANSGYGMLEEYPTIIDVVAGCNLTEYEVPARATSLQNYALHSCSKLKTLILHENINSLGSGPFPYSGSLETIICHAPVPPGFIILSPSEIEGIKEVKVPASSLERYKTDQAWSLFADKITAI